MTTIHTGYYTEKAADKDVHFLFAETGRYVGSVKVSEVIVDAIIGAHRTLTIRDADGKTLVHSPHPAKGIEASLYRELNFLARDDEEVNG